MSAHVRPLHLAVQDVCKCIATHVESVPVREMSGDKVVWEGMVEVFDVIKHPIAKRGYAWLYNHKGHDRIVTMMEVPPVTSPQTAVREAIASGEHS